MITTKDKELWLKYATRIRMIEEGKAFILPTRLNQRLVDALDDHTAEPDKLWNDLMFEQDVPKKVRDAAKEHNRNYRANDDKRKR